MTWMSFRLIRRWLALGICFVGLTTYSASGEDAAPSDANVSTLPDPAVEGQRYDDCAKLEKQLNMLFPDSSVYLILLQNRVVVKGQASDAEEHARIMQIVQAAMSGGQLVKVESSDNFDEAIVDMLDVPPDPQIMLHVKLVDIKRDQLKTLAAALKAFGPTDSRHENSSGGVAGIFGNAEVDRLITGLSNAAAAKVLAAPTLTVLNGHQASFLAGGEFPVPTIIGVGNGQTTAQTSFRGGSTSLSVRPEVIDRDWIKLELTPATSAVNDYWTMKLREGQSVLLTFAASTPRKVATETRVPFLGDLPVIGETFRQQRTHPEKNASDVLIVVTPELVRPMDPDQVPPRPGFHVTPPNDIELYSYAKTGGYPDRPHEETPQPAAIPSPYYLTDDVQYFPASPEFPLTATPIQHAGHSESPQPTPWPQRWQQPATEAPPALSVWNAPPPLIPVYEADRFESQIGRLRNAVTALEVAGLTEQVEAVKREIAKVELARKEYEAEELQRQILLLRRTLGVPSPLPESRLPAATY